MNKDQQKIRRFVDGRAYELTICPWLNYVQYAQDFNHI